MRAPAGDGARDYRPLVAVDGMRREDLPVLLRGERPALHRGVELVAPPIDHNENRTEGTTGG